MVVTDPIQEFDLQAYVDGQLPLGRRIEVEAYLSSRPEAAAQVMADLRIRGEVRLALAHGRVAPRPETREAARRLEQGLAGGLRVERFRRVAMIAGLVGLGWFAHEAINPFAVQPVVASVPPPVFVEEAVKAHEATKLREKVRSGSTSLAFSAADIRAATGITLPPLPKDWAVADSQIFPSAFGPSVEMALRSGTSGELTLFAVRSGSFGVQPVTLLQSERANAAYWQIGEVAYALVSKDQKAEQLAETAQTLARSLY